MKYFLSTSNPNVLVELLRNSSLSELFSANPPQDPSDYILISIDCLDVSQVFRSYKKKYFISLEYSLAQRFYYRIFFFNILFDSVFEWDLHVSPCSLSFIPFFPPRVGLMHESARPTRVVQSLEFYLSDLTSYKTCDVSVVMSNKSSLPWQRLRVLLIDDLSSTLELTRFGRNYLSVADKGEALLPFRYHIACENCDAGPSEKLWDPLLCSCVVFYAGDLSLVHPFLRRAIIPIPIDSPPLALRIIQSELATSKRLSELDNAYWYNAKNILLQIYSFSGFVERRICGS